MKHVDIDKLKWCPFCGAEAAFRHDGGSGWYIECTGQGCHASTNIQYALKEDVHPFLAERWNRRALIAEARDEPQGEGLSARVAEEMEWASGQLAVYLRHLRAKNDPLALAFTNALAEFNDVRAALSSPKGEALREAFMAGAIWAEDWADDDTITTECKLEAARRYPQLEPSQPDAYLSGGASPDTPKTVTTSSHPAPKPKETHYKCIDKLCGVVMDHPGPHEHGHYGGCICYQEMRPVPPEGSEG